MSTVFEFLAFCPLLGYNNTLGITANDKVFFLTFVRNNDKIRVV